MTSRAGKKQSEAKPKIPRFRADTDVVYGLPFAAFRGSAGSLRNALETDATIGAQLPGSARTPRHSRDSNS